MEKSIIVTIMVDEVELKYIDELLEGIEMTLNAYEKKRIQVTIQDEQLVHFIDR